MDKHVEIDTLRGCAPDKSRIGGEGHCAYGIACPKNDYIMRFNCFRQTKSECPRGGIIRDNLFDWTADRANDLVELCRGGLRHN